MSKKLSTFIGLITFRKAKAIKMKFIVSGIILASLLIYYYRYVFSLPHGPQ